MPRWDRLLAPQGWSPPQGLEVGEKLPWKYDETPLKRRWHIGTIPKIVYCAYKSCLKIEICLIGGWWQLPIASVKQTDQWTLGNIFWHYPKSTSATPPPPLLWHFKFIEMNGKFLLCFAINVLFVTCNFIIFTLLLF